MVRPAQIGAFLTLATALLALGCREELPPLGEALVVVDTDLPVPRIVNRLRIDMYTEDRTGWYLSQEIPTLDVEQWPVSFSVYNPDDEAPRTVILRLRAYPAGIVRDYRGERFTPRPAQGNPDEPAPIAEIPPGEVPRLMSNDGDDITPRSEPGPWVTVDRLAQITLTPGIRGRVRLLLGGECAGTMADLLGGITCLDADHPSEPLTDAELEPEMTRPGYSRAGTFAPERPCTAEVRQTSTSPQGEPLFDDEVCVPGGAYILGSAGSFGRGELSDMPQRIAIMPPFRMDRFEVSVGRWRDALARGFVPQGSPYSNDGPLSAIPSNPAACTYSDVPMGREGMPLNCIEPAAARAFCEFFGGDLLTEAAFEYVAMDAGRPAKTRFPWGDAEPDCNRAVYARQTSGAQSAFHTTDCKDLGGGVAPVNAAQGPNGDVALGTGVVGLAGGVSEMMRDSLASFDSACWAAEGLLSPSCVADGAASISGRGGNWAFNASSLASDYRGEIPQAGFLSTVGFRCSRDVP